MLTRLFQRMSCWLNTVDSDLLVLQKGAKQPHRIRSTTNTGNQIIWQLPGHFLELFAGFITDDRLKISHHHRIRIGTYYRAKEIVGSGSVGYPVSDGFIDSIF